MADASQRFLNTPIQAISEEDMGLARMTVKRYFAHKSKKSIQNLPQNKMDEIEYLYKMLGIEEES